MSPGIPVRNTDIIGLRDRKDVFLHQLTSESEIDNDIIMQYTGLKDKKGIEIYEGDILGGVRYGLHKVVAWNDTRTGFIPFSESVHWEEAEDIEVISNIYENPELLNSKEQ